MLRRLLLLALLLLLGPHVPVSESQMPPLTVPKGKFRFDLWGEFRDSDQRFFRGTREDLGADFSTTALGSKTFPLLLPAEAQLSTLGVSGFQYDLGATQATTLVNVGTTGFGLALGITDRLTVFGTVPIARLRIQPTLQLDGTAANAGFNPANPLFGTTAGQDAAALFFNDFGRTLDSLALRITNGFYDATNQRATAEAALTSGQSLRDNLRAFLLTPGRSSAFLPLASSTAAGALQGTIDAFQSLANGSLSLPSFTTKPLFPSSTLTQDEFVDFLTRVNGPIQAQPFDPIPTVSTLGDVEVGATYRLTKPLPGVIRSPALQITAIGLARLPTGTLAVPGQLFGRNIGDHQLDLEGSLVLDLVSSFWGLRATGMYTRQFATDVTRRITSPSQPFTLATSQALVRQDLGDIVSFQASPFLRLAPSLALHAGIRYWRKGSDDYTLLPGQDPTSLPAVTLLGIDSDVSATIFVAGLSFAHTGVGRRGDRKLPLDGSVEFQRIIGTTGGRVSDDRVVRATLRLYGRPPLP